jgi:hypothetical protein
MNSCSRCGEEVNSRRAEWLTGQELAVTCMSCGEKGGAAGQAHCADVAQAGADGVHG